jgi:hypothetical protein
MLWTQIYESRPPGVSDSPMGRTGMDVVVAAGVRKCVGVGEPAASLRCGGDLNVRRLVDWKCAVDLQSGIELALGWSSVERQCRRPAFHWTFLRERKRVHVGRDASTVGAFVVFFSCGASVRADLGTLEAGLRQARIARAGGNRRGPAGGVEIFISGVEHELGVSRSVVWAHMGSGAHPCAGDLVGCGSVALLADTPGIGANLWNKKRKHSAENKYERKLSA